MKNLYVIEHWVPFPASEYGGVHVVIASDDREACSLVLSGEWGRECYGSACLEAVEKATKIRVSDDEEIRVLTSFVT